MSCLAGRYPAVDQEGRMKRPKQSIPVENKTSGEPVETDEYDRDGGPKPGVNSTGTKLAI